MTPQFETIIQQISMVIFLTKINELILNVYIIIEIIYNLNLFPPIRNYLRYLIDVKLLIYYFLKEKSIK